MPITLRPLIPSAAVDFFRRKGYAVTFDYRDVDAAEHQAAFTVAKVAQLDLLAEIRAQVDDALLNGGTLASFIDQLYPKLARAGWWGVQTMTDPATGETREVQLGSPRRLATIYNTNLRTAHTEGQWQRMQETRDSLPYVMYDHTPSAWERPEHAAWDGLVLPLDDPWVAAHAPVKAWGCKCRLIPMSARQVERQGKTVGTAPDTPTRSYTNPRTGQTMSVPAGVDPEFNYPPGGRRSALTATLTQRIERLPADLRPAAVAALGPEAYRAWATKPAGAWPVGVLPARLVQALGSRSSVVGLAAGAEGAPAVAPEQLPALAAALDAATPGEGGAIRITLPGEGTGLPVELQLRPLADPADPLVLESVQG